MSVVRFHFSRIERTGGLRTDQSDRLLGLLATLSRRSDLPLIAHTAGRNRPDSLILFGHLKLRVVLLFLCGRIVPFLVLSLDTEVWRFVALLNRNRRRSPQVWLS